MLCEHLYVKSQYNKKLVLTNQTMNDILVWYPYLEEFFKDDFPLTTISIVPELLSKLPSFVKDKYRINIFRTKYYIRDKCLFVEENASIPYSMFFQILWDCPWIDSVYIRAFKGSPENFLKFNIHYDQLKHITIKRTSTYSMFCSVLINANRNSLVTIKSPYSFVNIARLKASFPQLYKCVSYLEKEDYNQDINEFCFPKLTITFNDDDLTYFDKITLKNNTCILFGCYLKYEQVIPKDIRRMLFRYIYNLRWTNEEKEEAKEPEIKKIKK